MPLEIRELVIKASVGDEKSSSSSNSAAGSTSDESTINEIVEKVLSIIKEKSER
ncbi:hypothetical protein KO493_05845 [Tamlana agarivorans]|uniref:Uncharacterized protein n=1 Tax=Pseudotamlana agarivorans TaxID=481183 RepID=A0ACC5U7C4_9FLAO|nr:DUF5908 family protein [Tamlana agarivorans]MBU2950211.1 hypothetical protein [Tamlana agarivorans]